MALTYYMDVHVPAAITEGLRRRAIDVLTSQDDGSREADDEFLLERATQLARVLVSQDKDLLKIAAARHAGGREFAGLVFVPQQGTSFGQVLDDLQLVAECCTKEELSNRVLYIPLA
jgi:hypothetical protein